MIASFMWRWRLLWPPDGSSLMCASIVLFPDNAKCADALPLILRWCTG